MGYPLRASSRTKQTSVLLVTLLLSILGSYVSQAQNSQGKMVIQRESSVPEELSAWFAAPGLPPTTPKPLLLPKAGENVSLEVPANFHRSDAQLKVYDGKRNRIAGLYVITQDLQNRMKGVQESSLPTNLLSPQWSLQKGGNTAAVRLIPKLTDPTAHLTEIQGKPALKADVSPKSLLSTSNIDFMEGETYTLRFSAKAEKETSLLVSTRRRTPTGEKTGLSRSITLTPKWQTFTFSFQATCPKDKRPPAHPTNSVTFRYAADGKQSQVYLAGDFTNWQNGKLTMEASPDGKVWTKTVLIPPGEHQYKFILNDEQHWNIDPYSPTTEDSSHNVNSLIQVGTPYSNALVFAIQKGQGTLQLAHVALMRGTEVSVRNVYQSLYPETNVTLATSDFQYAQAIQIPVRYKGHGAQGVTVTMKSPGTSYGSVQLLPSFKGYAPFSEVPVNQPLEITVTSPSHPAPYTTTRMIPGDDPAQILKQEVSLPAEWTDTQVVADDSPPPALALAGSTAPKEEGGSRLFVLLLCFFAVMLVVVGGLVWRLENKRKGDIQSSSQSGPNAGLLSGNQAPKIPHLPVLSTPPGIEAKEHIPRLFGMQGIYKGYSFPLSDPLTHIGRDISNSVALPQDSSISRRHATIQRGEEHYLMTDEGSANGIFINGVRLTIGSPHILKPGDEVEVGSTRFQFLVT